MNKLLPVSLFLYVTGTCLGATAIATIPNSYFSTVGFDEAHGNGMIGWTFSAAETFTVTEVGWYDSGGDGLSRAFQVGLWRADSGNFGVGAPVTQLLGTGPSGIVIPGGTTATLAGGIWRVVTLASPLVITPGYYQLGGLDTTGTPDPIRYFSGVDVTPPELSYGIHVNYGTSVGAFFYSATTSTMAPGFHSVDSDHFYLATGLELGPMLFGVPEPSVYGLAALGALSLSLRRRRLGFGNSV